MKGTASKSRIRVLHVAPGAERDSVKRYVEQLTSYLKKIGAMQEHEVFHLDKGKPYRSYAALLKRISNRNVDILHIQHEFGLFDSSYGFTFLAFFPILLAKCKANGTKIVVTWHTVPDRGEMKYIDYPSMITKTFLRHFVPKMYFGTTIRMIAKNADMNVLLTKAARQTMERDYKIPARKTIFIPNGIIDFKISAGKSEVSRFKRKYRLHGKIFSMVGLAFKLKGYHLMIDALPEVIRKYKDFTLVITGGTISPLGAEYLKSLQRQAKELGVEKHIVFTGYLSKEEMNALLKATDFFVYPYYHKVGDSAAINLAVVARKPIIASDIPAFEEFTKSGMAKGVDPTNKHELAKAVLKYLNRGSYKTDERLIDNYIKRNNMEVAARMHAEIYSRLKGLR